MLPFPYRGQILSPSPTTKPPLTQTGLMGLSHPATTVQLRQESCSNSLPDPATPITKGLAQYPREGGAQTAPSPHPQRVCKGDRDLAAHLFRSIHLRGMLQGAFCVGGGCTRTGGEQREAPAPPALCLSAEEFTCRENQLPPQSRQLCADLDGERDAAPLLARG